MMYVICSIEKNENGESVKNFWDMVESWEVDRVLAKNEDRFPDMVFCALPERMAIEKGII